MPAVGATAPESSPRLEELADRARGLVRAGGRTLLGITGPPGAGKSTVVATLLDRLRAGPPPAPGLAPRAWVAAVPMDGFHLADVELARLGRLDRKGAPDTFDAAGYVALLRRLREDVDDVTYAPGFERDLEQPIAGAVPVPRAARLVLTEGNYLLLDSGDWQRVAPHLAETWYVDAPDDLRRERLVARHVVHGKAPDAARAWVLRSDEPNARLVAATRDRADLVLTVR